VVVYDLLDVVGKVNPEISLPWCCPSLRAG
jgi:hypothetical protein